MAKPKILFIDAYDSFSNNVITFIEQSLNVSVVKITIDSPLPSDLSRSFAAIILGPGPGSPYKAADVGCFNDIWKLPIDQTIPVLGICLGFQCLVVNYGGTVQRLPYPRHGIETEIQSCNAYIFKGIPSLSSVQYHSLYARIGDGFGSQNLWSRSRTCPDLVPLAWDIDHPYSRGPPTLQDPHGPLGALNPKHILMSVRHETKPYYGVQFHSESVCSSVEARQVILNWWQEAVEWNFEHRHTLWSRWVNAGSVLSERMNLGTLNVASIRVHLRATGSEIVILDSEMNQASPLGNYSILGLVYPDTLKLSYTAGEKCVSLNKGEGPTTQSLSPYNGDVFAFLKVFMENHKRHHGDGELPFWGGLMGYISYEACLQTLKIDTIANPSRSDIQFAFVERSVVIDHTTGQLHIQSIKEDDSQWVTETTSGLSRLAELDSCLRSAIDEETASPASGASVLSGDVSPTGSNSTQPTSVESIDAARSASKYNAPSEADYCRKIAECLSEIRQGNSYELCLTDQTEVTIHTTPSMLSSWSRYLRLRTVNPAPFGAYIRLGPATVMSSSPERFMSWSRPNAQGQITCQFRPIKGTVKKQLVNSDGSVDHVDRATATKILSTPKERAENLMIVDLIRHDLAGVADSGSVRTKSLMHVEEYQSVYQLVTVIEGTVTASQSQDQDGSELPKGGIDVLAVSLPPGSMTGAPKKRSCQLLRDIERGTPRSIYSGVLGYMDVGGGGDFSVAIRTAYRWDDERTEGTETWRVGAGGAITAMSNDRDEWEEMHTKLDAVLRSFKNIHAI